MNAAHVSFSTVHKHRASIPRLLSTIAMQSDSVIGCRVKRKVDDMRKFVLQCTILAALLVFVAAEFSAQTRVEAVYAAKCAMCHGKEGSGDRPMGRVLKVKPFTDPTVLQMTDATMDDIVTNGKGRMPGFAKMLSTDDITSLIQYIHQLEGK